QLRSAGSTSGGFRGGPAAFRARGGREPRHVEEARALRSRVAERRARTRSWGIDGGASLCSRAIRPSCHHLGRRGPEEAGGAQGSSGGAAACGSTTRRRPGLSLELCGAAVGAGSRRVVGG